MSTVLLDVHTLRLLLSQVDEAEPRYESHPECVGSRDLVCQHQQDLNMDTFVHAPRWPNSVVSVPDRKDLEDECLLNFGVKPTVQVMDTAGKDNLVKNMA